MKFQDFDLELSLQEALKKLNFEECTPIQEQSIPNILLGKDIAGLAQTGTGKTAAFLLPLMDRILKGKKSLANTTITDKRSFNNWQNQHFILVLVPTRELADQVLEHAEKLKGSSSIEVVSVYGGTSYEKQKTMIENGAELVIATPGRLIDLYKSHIIDLKQVRAVVFDEADRMFDMGFKDDMKFVLRRLPEDRQFLVFSATLNFDVMNVAYQFGAQPIEVSVSRDQATAENVTDEVFHIGNSQKPSYLLSLLIRSKPRQAIIFTNYKNSVEPLSRFLVSNNMPAMGISSLLTQAQRTRVMTSFRAENNQNILVATDVAARGLDIKGVDLVINYELPDDPENYVHRIGRTGRAGNSGLAFSLASENDVEALQRIESFLKHPISIGWIEDKDLLKDYEEFNISREKVTYSEVGKKTSTYNDKKTTTATHNRKPKEKKYVKIDQHIKPDNVSNSSIINSTTSLNNSNNIENNSNKTETNKNIKFEIRKLQPKPSNKVSSNTRSNRSDQMSKPPQPLAVPKRSNPNDKTQNNVQKPHYSRAGQNTLSRNKYGPNNKNDSSYRSSFNLKNRNSVVKSKKLKIIVGLITKVQSLIKKIFG